jgi:outer membrane protein assembly factor BamD (BamD/ComL family)
LNGPRAGTARPIILKEVDSRPLEELPQSPADRARSEAIEAVAAHDMNEAVRAYRRLQALDAGHTLPMRVQLDVANQLAQMMEHSEAAAAYEAFLASYPTSPDADQVRLLLGIIYHRYLGDPARAIPHLERAAERLTQHSQRELAGQHLALARQALGPTSPPPDEST